MTGIELEILTALRQLDETARQPALAGERPRLLPLFTRLDELAATLPPDADPNLRHYLQRKSYEKARLLLEGREGGTAAGSCR